MHASSSGHRAPARSRHRRAESDPEYQHGNHPGSYAVRRAAPARQTGEHTAARTSRPPSPSRSRGSSIERVGNPFVPHQESLRVAHHHTHNAPGGRTTPSRAPSPLPRSGHQQNSSTQGSVSRAPHASSHRDGVPQPRSAITSNVPSIVAAPHPSHRQGQGNHPGAQVRRQSPPTPTVITQSTSVQRERSHRAAYQPPPTSATHVSRHHSTTHHHNHNSHHHSPSSSTYHVRHRSRSRPGPPSAASHRYASTFTQPVYGHESSVTSNASRTSLDGSVASQGGIHHATSQAPGVATSYHQGAAPSRTPSVSSQRSREHSHSRAPSPGIAASVTESHRAHRSEELPPSPPLATTELHHAIHRAHLLAARELFRSPHRPALPDSYDGRMQTRYVNMLLAMDDISAFYNALSAFFTWVLLIGFVLLPGTFASSGVLGFTTTNIAGLTHFNHFTLYIVAFVCVGVGALGMSWLWWRWHRNYIWIANRIFIPGFLNSISGLLSALSSIYGEQGGVFGKAGKSAIIATGTTALVCGILVVVYEHWLIRNIKLEHDELVGVELPGKYGEGVLGEKLHNHNGER